MPKTVRVGKLTIRLHGKYGGGKFAWKNQPTKGVPQGHPWRSGFKPKKAK